MTLVLVGQHAPDLVRALEGRAPDRPPVVFYRPSFGRRATRRDLTGPPGPPRAEFGEFDAIVGTAAGTYLIEAKWSRSGGVGSDGVFTVAEAQARRHRVMRHYLEAWRAAPPAPRYAGPGAGRPAGRLAARWPHFLHASDIRARLAPEGVAVPGPRTRLADTLTRVLGLLDRCGPVRDVLLFTDVAGEGDPWDPPTRTVPRGVRPAPFELVHADLRRSQLGYFVVLPTLPGDPGGARFSLV